VEWFENETGARVPLRFVLSLSKVRKMKKCDHFSISHESRLFGLFAIKGSAIFWLKIGLLWVSKNAEFYADFKYKILS
jgi:hypothetical protein